MYNNMPSRTTGQIARILLFGTTTLLIGSTEAPAATTTLVCTNANGTMTLNLNEAKHTVTMNDGRNGGAEAAVFDPEKITIAEQNGALLFRIDRVTGDFSLTQNDGKTYVMYKGCQPKKPKF